MSGYLIGENLRGEIRLLVDERRNRVSPGTPIRLEPRFEDMPQQRATFFRVCTFTGSWNINSEATVTFATVGTAAGTGGFNVATITAGDTAVAMNHLYTIGDACRPQVAYIGKVAGAWHLVNVEHHETAVVTTVSLTTAALEFGRKRIWAPYPGDTASLTISLTTSTSCS
jgi:hypothetical protein